jgi:hypothetical protein
MGAKAWMIVGAIALATLLACQAEDEALPDVQPALLQFECYPADYMRPRQGLAKGSCPMSNPGGTQPVIVDIGANGTVRSVRVPGQPTAVAECVFGAIGHWTFEPARTCAGDAVASEWHATPSDIFGVSPCLPMVPGDSSKL